MKDNKLINKIIAEEARHLGDEEYRKLLKEAAEILQKIPEGHLVELFKNNKPHEGV
jgi:hypothetical protein